MVAVFICPILLVFLLHPSSSSESPDAGATLKMINIVNNLTDEQRELEATVQDLKTYALLKNDPKGRLPSNFTICSTILTTKDGFHYPFLLLGKDDQVFVKTYIDNIERGLVNTSKVSISITRSHESHQNSYSVPTIFPDQWVKSCLAISVEFGSIQWVLDGILVLDITSDTLKEAADQAPTNLVGKIVFGAAKDIKGWT